MTTKYVNKVTVDKATDEVKVLIKLLKGLGFRVSKGFENLDKAQIVHGDALIDFYSIHYSTDNGIGSCRIYTVNDGSLLISSTLIKHFLPEEVVSQLLLLGYEEKYNNPFLDYEVTVNE